MTPERFIRKNLTELIDKQGVPFASTESIVDEGVRYWQQTARFKRGAWNDVVSHVKKIIKRMDK